MRKPGFSEVKWLALVIALKIHWDWDPNSSFPDSKVYFLKSSLHKAS